MSGGPGGAGAAAQQLQQSKEINTIFHVIMSKSSLRDGTSPLSDYIHDVPIRFQITDNHYVQLRALQ